MGRTHFKTAGCRTEKKEDKADTTDTCSDVGKLDGGHRVRVYSMVGGQSESRMRGT